METCKLSPDCSFPPHAADEHPCGQPIVAGQACRYCGAPEPVDEQGGALPCPTCWRPATIADLKALAAEAGLSTTLTTHAE